MLGKLFGRPKDKRLSEPRAAAALFQLFCKHVEEGARVRLEDMLTVGAAVTADVCIRKIGEIDPEDRALTPGQAIFSDAMNGLLTGDASTWDALSAGCLFGQLRDQLSLAGYRTEDFPPLDHVLAMFAAGVGSRPWGTAPLSTPTEYAPRVVPLRAAFECRSAALDIIGRAGVDVMGAPRLCSLGLAQGLAAAQGIMSPTVALTLVFETLNAMAKTVPIQARHLQDLERAG